MTTPYHLYTCTCTCSNYVIPSAEFGKKKLLHFDKINNYFSLPTHLSVLDCGCRNLPQGSRGEGCGRELMLVAMTTRRLPAAVSFSLMVAMAVMTSPAVAFFFNFCCTFLRKSCWVTMLVRLVLQPSAYRSLLRKVLETCLPSLLSLCVCVCVHRWMSIHGCEQERERERERCVWNNLDTSLVIFFATTESRSDVNWTE